MWLLKLLAAGCAVAAAVVIFAWAVEKLPKTKDNNKSKRRKK